MRPPESRLICDQVGKSICQAGIDWVRAVAVKVLPQLTDEQKRECALSEAGVDYE